MIKQDIDKKFFALDLQTKLITHKSKRAAHFYQESINLRHKRSFQFQSTMLLTQIKKISGVFGVERVYRV